VVALRPTPTNGVVENVTTIGMATIPKAPRIASVDAPKATGSEDEPKVVLAPATALVNV